MNKVELSGRIEAIHLEDINKTLKNHTYNIGIDVRHTRIVGETQFDLPAVITVRVNTIFTGTDAQKDLSPSEWGEYKVGADVTLNVELTSPGLALLRLR